MIVAYLLHTYEDMSLLDAFRLVATRRRIWPNDGFCRHLVELEKTKRQKKDSSQSPDVQLVGNQLEKCAIGENKEEKTTGDEALATKPE